MASHDLNGSAVNLAKAFQNVIVEAIAGSLSLCQVYNYQYNKNGRTALGPSHADRER
jgi:hypothetical protein